MDLIFEYCFYAGVLLTIVGLIWTGKTLLGGKLQKLAVPIGVLLLGVALVVGPGVVSKLAVVDLGPRETIVDTERHLSLTGWDGTSYAFLSQKPDTVVLQMGNADVTDETLDVLVPMERLRELDLNDTAITDAGLQTLSELPSLTTLRLRGTLITDAGFRDCLMNHPALQQVDLRETAVSAATVQAWKDADANRRAFH